MENNYFQFLSKNRRKSNRRIVAVDTEWAKNWKMKEKFIPFSISIHSIYPENIKGSFLDINNLYMEAELYFRSHGESIQDYIDKVENMLSKYIDDNTLIVGHQLTSDLHTFIQCSNKKLPTVSYLIDVFKTRKINKAANKKNVFSMADTRYDINNRIKGEEKLRSVSLRLNIFAVQTELDTMSLTRMYNTYILDGDMNKREKLLVMNWRHAFQTALVWIVDSVYTDKIPYNPKFKAEFLVTNDLMFAMGKDYLTYLNSDAFKESMTFEGIIEYIKKYQPDKINNIGVGL